MGHEARGGRRVQSGSLTDEQRSASPKDPQPLLGPGRFGPSGFVAPQSKIHKGYSPSSRLAIRPNLPRRALGIFMRWLLEIVQEFVRKLRVSHCLSSGRVEHFPNPAALD